jgi:hypothetical protein
MLLTHHQGGGTALSKAGFEGVDQRRRHVALKNVRGMDM